MSDIGKDIGEQQAAARKWLEEHQFLKTQDEAVTRNERWELRGYNGMNLFVDLTAAGYVMAWGSMQTEDAEVCTDCMQVGVTVEAVVDAVLDRLCDNVEMLKSDLAVTRKAFNAKLDYAECEAGFYEGMPGLEDADASHIV